MNLSIKSNYLAFAAFILCFALNLKAQNIENAYSNPISVSGSLGLNLGAYGVSGIESRARPFDYALTANACLNLYGVNMPFSATFGSQQRDYTQPFNQFGISPEYKWITLHLGWRSMTFSPYTLAGYNFLGAGMDLNPGIVRFSAMFGRFSKASSGDSNLTRTASPTYERNGYAIKLGFGSHVNYFDIIMLKAADNINSLSDSSALSSQPGENLVLGLSSRFTLFDAINFELDGAASAYTLDARSDEAEFSKTNSILQNLKSIFTVRNSTRLNAAVQASALYRSKNYALKLAYKLIEPDYKSMGAYYAETDVENITLAPSFNFLNNSLRFGFSIGVQNDNLLNSKINTTQRTIGSADISYQKPEYGVDLRYTSYGIAQKRGLNPVIDSIKIERINSSINAIGRYTVQSESNSENYLISCVYQTLNDNNAKTAALTESDNYSLVLTYQNSKYSNGFTWGVNLNAVQSIVGNMKNVYLGPSLSASKSVDRFTYGGNLGYQFQFLNGISSGATLCAAAQGAYQINSTQSIRLDLNAVNVSSSASEITSFGEYRLNLSYVYNF